MRLIHKSNILFIPFIILTGSIIILCVLVQVLLQSSLDDMKVDAAIVTMARDERTIAHQVVNSIAADNLAGELTDPSADSLFFVFKKLHTSLVAPQKGNQQFKKELASINDKYGYFSNAIILNSGSDSTSNDDFVLLLNTQSDYIRALDAYIAVLTGNSEAKIERFRREEMLLTAFSLLIVLLEVLFIFLPAIKKIKKQSRQFRVIAFNHSHIIRQPLANIKGLLELVDCNSFNEESKEIFTMLKEEAEKLDDVIKHSIYNTSEK